MAVYPPQSSSAFRWWRLAACLAAGDAAKWIAYGQVADAHGGVALAVGIALCLAGASVWLAWVTTSRGAHGASLRLASRLLPTLPGLAACQMVLAYFVFSRTAAFALLLSWVPASLCGALSVLTRRRLKQLIPDAP